jgi:hypothetical protein
MKKLVKLYDRIDRGTPKELRNKVAYEVRKLRKNSYLRFSYTVTPTATGNPNDYSNLRYPLHVSLQKSLNAIIRYDYDRCGDKRYNHLIK